MKKQTLLWRIEIESQPGTSFLLGTMHVRDSRMFEGMELITGSICQCEAFAAEFNLDEATAVSPVSLSYQLPMGQTLGTMIPPGRYRKLRNMLLKVAGIDLDFFQHAPPFFIVNLFSEKILLTDMPVSLDEYLWNFAKQQGKFMYGVETLQEQMEVLKKIPLAEQVKMLLEMGRNVERYRQHLAHMAVLYQRKDVQRLYKTVKKNSRGLRKLLLYHRNEIMAERIAELAATRSVFAAIGAAHLGGAQGVIRLLKKKGLKLLPVPIQAISPPAQFQIPA